MITARIYSNGLGNQMFQYAAARSLADKTRDDLALDCRDFTVYALKQRIALLPGLRSRVLDQGAPRNYALDRFNIRATGADSFQLARRGIFNSRKLRNLAERFSFLKGDLIQEKSLEYAPFQLDRSGFHYVEGRWQSWKYFAWNRKRLLKDFSLKKEPGPRSKRLLEEMRKKDSVCLHVRLGDYATAIGAANYLNVLPEAYYQKALGTLRRSVRKPHYFLFSDEPQKAVQRLKLKGDLTIVDHNGAEPEEDLRLMKACQHFIIANSTFSWWGAWLAANPRKKVVAPLRWFSTAQENTKDLTPPEWVRV